jgi:SAM-dependent methyltransferase
MGLTGYAVDAIGREHVHRPINGDIVFIGRQTVTISPSDLASRLRAHGIAVDDKAIEIDRTTTYRTLHASHQASDRSIFWALGGCRVKALDVSPYEGAEIIHNLNEPIPDSLRESADFIVDGSTLDNVFDPAMALRNLAAILKPGGRLLMINAWSPRDGSYQLCSPAWYFDFFVTNGFADCKTYVCISAGNRANTYWLDPAFMRTAEARIRVPLLACWWRIPSVLVLAEKACEPLPALVSPTQAHYRSEREWGRYLDNLTSITQSTRPHLVRSIGRMLPRTRSPRSNGFVWIDGNYNAKPLGGSLDPAVRLVRRVRSAFRSVAAAAS